MEAKSELYLQTQIDDLKRKTDIMIVTAIAFLFLGIAITFIAVYF